MQTKLLLVMSLNDDAGRQDEWMSCEGDAELLLYVALTVVADGCGDECLSSASACEVAADAARVGVESRTGRAGEGARRSGGLHTDATRRREIRCKTYLVLPVTLSRRFCTMMKSLWIGAKLCASS